MKLAPEKRVYRAKAWLKCGNILFCFIGSVCVARVAARFAGRLHAGSSRARFDVIGVMRHSGEFDRSSGVWRSCARGGGATRRLPVPARRVPAGSRGARMLAPRLVAC